MELASSQIAAKLFREFMGDPEVEELWVIALNPMCQVIKASMLFRGTVDSCFIHPRDIFRFALLTNASSVLVCHNHPSGCPKPSEADEELTFRIKEVGRILQIPLLDHVILTKDKYFSFAESRWRGKESFDRQWLLRSRLRPMHQRG